MSSAFVELFVKLLEAFFTRAFEAYKERLKQQGVDEFIEEGRREIGDGFEQLDDSQIRDAFNLSTRRKLRKQGSELKSDSPDNE